MSFKIIVKTVQGTILTFNNVKSYEVEPGDIIKFVDSKTGQVKRFHSSKCEIQELEIEVESDARQNNNCQANT